MVSIQQTGQIMAMSSACTDGELMHGVTAPTAVEASCVHGVGDRVTAAGTRQ